ncbi:hypothetical protein CTA2_8961 [Colletotrichum tanaceti]|nr:hypothetical protein CTA2_8961 [Colletotrichum tanaceti]
MHTGRLRGQRQLAAGVVGRRRAWGMHKAQHSLLADNETLDDLKGAHGLAETKAAVAAADVPLLTACDIRPRSLTHVGGGEGGWHQNLLDLGEELGHDDGRLPEEARQVPFESLHVRVACVDRLAGGLVHDVCAVLGGREKARTRRLQHLPGALPPDLLPRVVGHDGGAVEVDAGRVGEGQVVRLAAVVAGVGAVVHLEVFVDEAHVDGPVPDVVGPCDVGGVARGGGQPGAELEEAAVADRVLVVEAVGVALVDLPQETAAAVRRVPARGERVEGVAAHGEPGGDAGVGLGEVSLGGGHDGEAPEAEVVVALLGRVLRRHVVEVRACVDAGGEGLRDHIVVCRVAGVVEVIQHDAPEGAGLPPVVWLRQVTDHLGTC